MNAYICLNRHVRLYVSNIRTRTKEDNSSKLKQEGISILNEDLAKFEVKYNKELRLETVSLSVQVESNSHLVDLLVGRRKIQGIFVPGLIHNNGG